VVDFGEMGVLKQFLTCHFDHTFLICADDTALLPDRELIPSLRNLMNIVVLEKASAEFIASWVLEKLNHLIGVKLPDWHSRGVKVVEVICWEDSKNSARYSL